MRAILKNYRQSPRKVRLVADLVRGKRVPVALTTLNYLTKRASAPIRSVIETAAINAKTNFKVDPDSLIIKDIRVDEGVTMKRSMPRARGSAYLIKKRTSHVTLELGSPERENRPVAIKSEADISEESES